MANNPPLFTNHSSYQLGNQVAAVVAQSKFTQPHLPVNTEPQIISSPASLPDVSPSPPPPTTSQPQATQPKGKKRGRPSKVSEANRDWNDEEVTQLIDIWEMYECLYYPKNKDFLTGT